MDELNLIELESSFSQPMTANLLSSVIVGQPPSNGVCSRHRSGHNGYYKSYLALRCFVWVENNCVVAQLPGQNEKTSSLNIIFNNKHF